MLHTWDRYISPSFCCEGPRPFKLISLGYWPRPRVVEDQSSEHVLVGQFGKKHSVRTEERKLTMNNWLVVTGTWLDCFSISIGNVIIPIDELIFFRRVETTNQIIFLSSYRNIQELLDKKHMLWYYIEYILLASDFEFTESADSDVENQDHGWWSTQKLNVYWRSFVRKAAKSWIN